MKKVDSGWQKAIEGKGGCSTGVTEVLSGTGVCERNYRTGESLGYTD